MYIRRLTRRACPLCEGSTPRRLIHQPFRLVAVPTNRYDPSAAVRVDFHLSSPGLMAGPFTRTSSRSPLTASSPRPSSRESVSTICATPTPLLRYRLEFIPRSFRAPGPFQHQLHLGCLFSRHPSNAGRRRRDSGGPNQEEVMTTNEHDLTVKEILDIPKGNLTEAIALA